MKTNFGFFGKLIAAQFGLKLGLSLLDKLLDDGSREATSDEFRRLAEAYNARDRAAFGRVFREFKPKATSLEVDDWYENMGEKLR